MIRSPSGSPSCCRVRSWSSSPTASSPNTGPVSSDSVCGSEHERPLRRAQAGRAGSPGRCTAGRRPSPAGRFERSARPAHRATVSPFAGLSARSAASSSVGRRLVRDAVVGDAQLPAGRLARLVDGHAGMELGQRQLAVVGGSRTPRSVTTHVTPSPDASCGSRAARRTPAASAASITNISRHQAAISGAPPPPGSRTLRAVVVADHGAVEVAAPSICAAPRKPTSMRPPWSQ